MQNNKLIWFKEIVTAILALSLIIPLAILLFENSQNPSIEISPQLIALASVILGYYFGKYTKI